MRNEIQDSLNTGDVNTKSAICDENSVIKEIINFKPIYLIGEWKDRREDQRVTVAVLMPSRSFENPRDHDLKVSDDGMNLQLTVTWPRSMTDLNFLYKLEIDSDPKIFEHHPRVLPFRPYLRKLCTKVDP